MNSFDRKPNPGMILQARDELGLCFSGSVLIGDKASDIAAAKAAEVGRTVLLTPSFSVSASPLPDLKISALREKGCCSEALPEPAVKVRLRAVGIYHSEGDC